MGINPEMARFWQKQKGNSEAEAEPGPTQRLQIHEREIADIVQEARRQGKDPLTDENTIDAVGRLLYQKGYVRGTQKYDWDEVKKRGQTTDPRYRGTYNIAQQLVSEAIAVAEQNLQRQSVASVRETPPPRAIGRPTIDPSLLTTRASGLDLKSFLPGLGVQPQPAPASRADGGPMAEQFQGMQTQRSPRGLDTRTARPMVTSADVAGLDLNSFLPGLGVQPQPPASRADGGPMGEESLLLQTQRLLRGLVAPASAPQQQVYRRMPLVSSGNDGWAAQFAEIRSGNTKHSK
jgi:hypothetical protein